MKLFTEAFHNNKHWIELRRKELLDVVAERTNHVVQYGPFEGMIILPRWSWGDGDHVAKLLGLYENELFDSVEKIIAYEPDLILNIGSAEGFWGLGMALATGAKTVLIDIDPLALEIARDNAKINGVENLIYDTSSSIETINLYLQDASRPAIFMDCEGAEKDLLDPVKNNLLLKSIIIVECHEQDVPGITEKIQQNFSATHSITKISQGAKNPYIDPIHDFDDFDKMIICIERRACTMHWLYLEPK